MCEFGFSLGLGASVVPWHSLTAADPPDTWRHPHCNKKKNRNKEKFSIGWKEDRENKFKSISAKKKKSDILKPHWPSDRAKRLFYNGLKEQRCSALSASLSLHIHFKSEKLITLRDALSCSTVMSDLWAADFNDIGSSVFDPSKDTSAQIFMTAEDKTTL